MRQHRAESTRVHSPSVGEESFRSGRSIVPKFETGIGKYLNIECVYFVFEENDTVSLSLEFHPCRNAITPPAFEDSNRPLHFCRSFVRTFPTTYEKVIVTSFV